jgi:hypothetical protein
VTGGWFVNSAINAALLVWHHQNRFAAFLNQAPGRAPQQKVLNHSIAMGANHNKVCRGLPNNREYFIAGYALYNRSSVIISGIASLSFLKHQALG